jgi:hypothetical protein
MRFVVSYLAVPFGAIAFPLATRNIGESGSSRSDGAREGGPDDVCSSAACSGGSSSACSICLGASVDGGGASGSIRHAFRLRQLRLVLLTRHASIYHRLIHRCLIQRRAILVVDCTNISPVGNLGPIIGRPTDHRRRIDHLPGVSEGNGRLLHVILGTCRGGRTLCLAGDSQLSLKVFGRTPSVGSGVSGASRPGHRA